ncbi:MAG: M42 family metallopeptidase [Fimbriimonas sp.]
MEPLAILQQFVSAYGPPGQEDEIREALQGHLKDLDLNYEVDAKGNLLVWFGDTLPEVVVTAHMDEIAMIVRRIEPDGSLRVGGLGGLHPWKLGEGPVDILTPSEAIPGVLGFGGIHTEDPSAVSVRARDKAVTWDMARVFTGVPAEELRVRGVRPGTRVVVSRSRRTLRRLGDHVAGHFLDDRADLVAWILAINEVRDWGRNFLFAATASEEVGGEGALFLLHGIRPAVCIALELGANVPDAPVQITAAPTVWANDGYAATAARDLELLAQIGEELGMDLQFQAFSRGGSDASCAASHGLCARPITLGLPMENSHGYEVMHRDAMDALARLTVALLRKV